MRPDYDSFMKMGYATVTRLSGYGSRHSGLARR